MKPEQVYQHLKELAEKLSITVKEENLRITPDIHVQSGLCRVKDEQVFVMDKHKKIGDKIELLAACLGEMPVEDVYIVPAVRDVLEQHRPRIRHSDHPEPTDSDNTENSRTDNE